MNASEKKDEERKTNIQEIWGSSKKKLFKRHFRIMWSAWSKKNFSDEILGQRTISVQIFKKFGCHHNHGY